MRKRALLAVLISCAAIQTEGMQEFRGRAAPLTDDIIVDDYAAMSCAYVEKAGNSVCAGQCAEIWCDNDEIAECTLETRVVRVADRYTNCQGGDLVLSRYAFQQFSGGNTHLAPVRWKCVDCGTNTGGSAGSYDSKLQFIEEALYRGSGSLDDTTSDGSTTSDTIEDEMKSFSAVYSGYADNDTSESLDTEVEIPSTDNSNDTGNSNIKSDSSSSGEGDDRGSGDFWSGSGSIQTDTNSWNAQGPKTAPPMHSIPSLPSTMIPSYSPCSASSSSTKGTSSSLAPVQAPPVSPTGSSNGGSWFVPPTWIPSSGGSSTSVPTPASTSLADGGSSYLVGTVTAHADDLPDNAGTGLSGSTSDTTAVKNQPPPLLPQHRHFNRRVEVLTIAAVVATCRLLQRPFFYASIVLGIVGLVGVIVGYQAKRKRNHRIELRAFRMSAHQSTRTDTPASNSHSVPSPLVPQTRFDNRSIVIL